MGLCVHVSGHAINAHYQVNWLAVRVDVVEAEVVLWLIMFS